MKVSFGLILTLVSSAFGCPGTGWIIGDEYSCYLMSPGQMNWISASEVCTDLGNLIGNIQLYKVENSGFFCHSDFT